MMDESIKKTQRELDFEFSLCVYNDIILEI